MNEDVNETENENETENRVVVKITDLGENSRVEVNGTLDELSNAIIGLMSDVALSVAEQSNASVALMMIQELAITASKRVMEDAMGLSEESTND